MDSPLAPVFDAFGMSRDLIRSIGYSCSADHDRRSAKLVDWTANKDLVSNFERIQSGAVLRVAEQSGQIAAAVARAMQRLDYCIMIRITLGTA